MPSNLNIDIIIIIQTQRVSFTSFFFKTNIKSLFDDITKTKGGVLTRDANSGQIQTSENRALDGMVGLQSCTATRAGAK